MGSAWLLVAVVFVGVARGAVSDCWEHPSCRGEVTESSMMECIQLCRSDLATETADLTAEIAVVPGDAHLQPPPPTGPSSSPQVKRSYSMEHFRWGKPIGRKRRPAKVFTADGVEEESAEAFPGEMRRREEQEVTEDGVQQKKDGSYKMKHFRWSSPPASKRYGGGGFTKSWDERSQTPLITLFRNVINRDGQQRE